MKKSTILLLVVVYIVSFFVIGLLGHSIRNYNPEVYASEIIVSDPDNRTTVIRDNTDQETGEKLSDYEFIYRNYKPGDGVRIKAEVKPDKCTYPNVDFLKDPSDTTFNIETRSSNPNIEQNFALITLNKMPSLEEIAVSASFIVRDTNPGAHTITLRVIVTFVYAF